jgi:hypothetical protein
MGGESWCGAFGVVGGLTGTYLQGTPLSMQRGHSLCISSGARHWGQVQSERETHSKVMR